MLNLAVFITAIAACLLCPDISLAFFGEEICGCEYYDPSTHVCCETSGTLLEMTPTEQDLFWYDEHIIVCCGDTAVVDLGTPDSENLQKCNPSTSEAEDCDVNLANTRTCFDSYCGCVGYDYDTHVCCENGDLIKIPVEVRDVTTRFVCCHYEGVNALINLGTYTTYDDAIPLKCEGGEATECTA